MEPETKKARLYCQAQRRWSLHRFLATYKVDLPRAAGPNGEPLGGPAYEFVFQCQDPGCLAVRRWGTADRLQRGEA